jgi:hypothetical protein
MRWKTLTVILGLAVVLSLGTAAAVARNGDSVIDVDRPEVEDEALPLTTGGLAGAG